MSFMHYLNLFAIISAHFCALVNAWATNGTQFITGDNRTQPLTLAVSPVCGPFNSSNFTEVNTGIQLNATKTVVAFGDSWTSNGSNGTIPFAPIQFPPNPSAGASYGNNYRARASNGYVWVEDLANTLGAKLINYAVGGAVIDLQAWNSTKNGPVYTSDNLLRVDFIEEVTVFSQQGHFLSDLNPNTTLYTVQFGINDVGQYDSQGGNWTQATNTYTNLLGVLQGLGAKSVLIHWLYTSANVTNDFQTNVHAYLKQSHAQNGTNYAEVNFYNLFNAIGINNGSAFGYTNTTCLASQNTTNFGCNDPDHSVFYIPGHPSLTTHELMTQYTIQTMTQCLSSY